MSASSTADRESSAGAKIWRGNLKTGESVFQKEVVLAHTMLFQQFPERAAIFSDKARSSCHVTFRSDHGFGKVILFKSCYGAVFGLGKAQAVQLGEAAVKPGSPFDHCGRERCDIYDRF